MEGTYTLRIIEYFVELFLNVAPYLLVSIVLNVAAARYVRGRTLQFSTKSETVAILSAAVIGLASPLPTYAAIPIGLSLLSAQVPFSAIMAFILASPLMNPTVFFLTATQLGMEMAIARTLAAFLLAVLGGFLTFKVFKNPYPEKPTGEQPLVLGAALPEGGSLVGMVRISFSPTHVYFGFGSYTSGKIDEVLRDGTLRRTVVQPAGGRLIGLLPENLYFFEGFSLLELISTIPGAVKQPLASGVFPRSSVEDSSSLFFYDLTSSKVYRLDSSNPQQLVPLIPPFSEGAVLVNSTHVFLVGSNAQSGKP